MAKPKRIGHLVINVKDQEASTRFYTEVLGFEVAVERPGFGTFLTCGRIHHDLALFQAKAARRTSSRRAGRTMHPGRGLAGRKDYLQQAPGVLRVASCGPWTTAYQEASTPDRTATDRLFCNSFDT